MTINIKVQIPTPKRIKKFEFVSLTVVGSGGFGTCFKAFYKPKNLVCCLKKINRTSKIKAALQSFQAETKKEFFFFDHPNIVKLLAATPVHADSLDVDLDSLLMAFEFVEGRNLQRLLDDEQEIVDTARMCKYGIEISSALQYVHNQGIMHLDVKPLNIMVTREDSCKLADFGCSQYKECYRVESMLTGTFAYRAPELHRGLAPSPKCDTYALGICLWQFCSRSMPFAGKAQDVVIYNVVRNHLRPTFSNLNVDAHQDYQRLASECWSPKPNDRPSLQHVLNVLASVAATGNLVC